MNISALSKLTDRNQYGELNTNFEEAINAAYPEIKFICSSPGCWGHNAAIELEKKDGQWLMTLPDGKYSSNRHHHTAGHAVMAIESSRKKLNLAGCPLYLLSSYAYNGTYKALKKSYWLFGKNEDSSYFLHQVRPKFGETGDLEQVRKWMWELRDGEAIAARQGDLAFVTIPKGRTPRGEQSEDNYTWMGNHRVDALKVISTKHKRYVLDPSATHYEHHAIALEGWHELRLAKVWLGTRGD